jgi:hypothetical protein
MRWDAVLKRIVRLERRRPIEGPPRIRVPDVAGAPSTTERGPDDVPPSLRRIVIPDYDDRYPPGWFE